VPRAADVDPDTARLAVPALDATFGEAELDGVPGPAATYLRAAIAPGTPIARAARLAMRGRIKLGPRWVPFRASEVLAPHEGFVWAGRAAGVLTGSDRYVGGRGRLDWRLLGLVRVAHAEGPDVDRGAAARAAGEAVWLPTSLVPRLGARWSAGEGGTLRASCPVGDVDVSMELEIDAAGRLQAVRFRRWGDPQNAGEYGWHTFGMTVTEVATFDGLTVPVAGRAGWHHGTDRWEEGEFFRYRITALEPVGPASSTAPPGDNGARASGRPVTPRA
jgi:hypothetical protein